MEEHYLKPNTYAVWSKNKEIRYCSTSGGAFSEFAKVILLNGGIVIGASYNESNLVEHTIISEFNELNKIRQSKYLQSTIGDIFKKIKKQLTLEKLVGFCGTPCQIAGLYSFLGKNYDNLLTMDFICRGVNSPKAFKSWLNEVETQEHSKVNKVWFKYKDGGWKSSPTRTRLDFEDGHFKVLEGEKNLFMYGYLTSNLYIRPCCGNCKFKGVPRKSDVTFADFWGIEKNLDDDKGTSLVLINSDKGKKLFNKAKKNLNYYERDFNEIFNGNPMFISSTEIPVEAHDFLCDLDKMTFSDSLKKYGGYPASISIWKKLIYKSKQIVNKIIKHNTP